MAAGLYSQYLTESSRYVKITSAGLHALVGKSAAQEVQVALLQKNIDISSHRARQLTPAMILDADLVLVMDDEQKKFVTKMVPQSRGRVFLLGEWGGYDIPDPYRQPASVFQDCLQLIEISWEEWQNKL